MTEEQIDRPNVLFLVVDSLRYDAVCGDWQTTTPNIDRLADEGVSFTNCYSQGISTAPAMTAMLTGSLPLDYGGHWYLQDDRSPFAEVFRRYGYQTGAFHSNPYVSQRREFDRGFDRFKEDAIAFEPDERLEAAPEKLLRLANRVSRVLSRVPYTPGEPTNETTLDMIDDADHPWFHWTQYMDVHGPYLGGGDFRYRNKFRAEKLWLKAAVRNPDGVTDAEHAALKRDYRLEIEYLDEIIGELLTSLERRGERENTIVVLTADHGDEFYEHGRYGHGNVPFDELSHVPLIMQFPDSSNVPSGTIVTDIVRSIDILPTILDSVGIEESRETPTYHTGVSLLPLIQGETHNETPLVVTEKRVRGEDALRIALRTEDWKFIHDGKADEKYLYDLNEDPEEQRNLVEQRPSIRDKFTQQLTERFNRIEATSANVIVPDSETKAGVEERLKALGYRD